MKRGVMDRTGRKIHRNFSLDPFLEMTRPRRLRTSFYACNRFVVDDASHLEYFGQDDHYRSGFEPCSVVQQLTIAMNHSSDYDYD